MKMLTKDDLKEIARFTGLKPYQQEKHYIQTIILHALSTSTANELVFKGGTALFFLYNMRRFSEDLDFTMIQPFDISKIATAIKKDLELLGIPHHIDKIEENNISLSFRVSAEGPLYAKEIERCYVSVEISKREKVHHQSIKEIRSVYSDIPPFTLNIMDEKEIIAEKIRALLTRNYARDLYDLFFLLKKNISFDRTLINKKLSYYNKKFNKRELKEKIGEKKEIWETELKPLVMGELPSFAEVEKFIFKVLKEQ